MTRKVFWEVKQNTELATQLNLAHAELVTFPDTPPEKNYYFMKTSKRGIWNLDLPDETTEVIQDLRKTNKGFDSELRWIVWGHGGTAIYQFLSGGRIEWVEGKHENPEHPLQKVRRRLFVLLPLMNRLVDPERIPILDFRERFIALPLQPRLLLHQTSKPSGSAYRVPVKASGRDERAL